MTTDYTNPRWHVEGPNVTHEDIPGMIWVIHDRTDGEYWASRAGNVWMHAHAARAWLAAQPKPLPKVGMRIEATLRGGAVVTGEVTEASNQFLYIGYILMFRDFGLPANTHPYDVMSWHEVTS